MLRLHHGTIKSSECEDRNGYRVTKPFRTIIDLVRKRAVSPEFIEQTILQSIDIGCLIHAQYRSLKETPRVGRRVAEIMDDKK